MLAYDTRKFRDWRADTIMGTCTHTYKEKRRGGACNSSLEKSRYHRTSGCTQGAYLSVMLSPGATWTDPFVYTQQYASSLLFVYVWEHTTVYFYTGNSSPTRPLVFQRIFGILTSHFAQPLPIFIQQIFFIFIRGFCLKIKSNNTYKIW